MDMDEKDRIKILIKSLNKKQDEFEELCGFKKYKLRNALKKDATLTTEMVNKILKNWPEYEVWIKSGYEIPEKGQISPLTKKTSIEMKVGS